MDINEAVKNLGRNAEYLEGLGSEAGRYKYLKKEFSHPTNWYYFEYFKYDACKNMFRYFKHKV